MSYQFGHVDRDDRIDYVEEPQFAEELPRRNLSGPALVVGVMALFAGGLWFAYHEGTKHPDVTAGTTTTDNVPLIRADADPVKIKPPPDRIGGLNIPDKDNPLYGALSGAPPVEKILPPPPAPEPRPAPPSQTQIPSPTVAPAPPAAVAPPPQPAAVAPKPAPKPSPQQTTLPDGVRVQLASLRSPEAARDEWTRLKHDNPDLLGKLTAVAVRADLGERGIWYKIEAGPLASKAAADRLCSEMKQRDLGCQLVR